MDCVKVFAIHPALPNLQYQAEKNEGITQMAKKEVGPGTARGIHVTPLIFWYFQP